MKSLELTNPNGLTHALPMQWKGENLGLSGFFANGLLK